MPDPVFVPCRTPLDITTTLKHGLLSAFGQHHIRIALASMLLAFGCPCYHQYKAYNASMGNISNYSLDCFWEPAHLFLQLSLQSSTISVKRKVSGRFPHTTDKVFGPGNREMEANPGKKEGPNYLNTVCRIRNDL